MWLPTALALISLTGAAPAARGPVEPPSIPCAVLSGRQRLEPRHLVAGQRSLYFTIRRVRSITAPAIPLTLSVGFGGKDECATAAWNPPGGSAPRCRAKRRALVCQ